LDKRTLNELAQSEKNNFSKVEEEIIILSELRFDAKSRTITLYFNPYEGDGKTWCAKIENGKYSFLKGTYAEENRIRYVLEGNGEYVAHQPITQKFSKDIFFKLERDIIKITKRINKLKK